jgi:hypothetical protein
MGDSRFNQSCSKVLEIAAKGVSGEEGHLSVVVCTAHLRLPSPTPCRYPETVEDGAATTSVFGRNHEDSHGNRLILVHLPNLSSFPPMVASFRLLALSNREGVSHVVGDTYLSRTPTPSPSQSC